jgi:hypothetical protein
LKVIGVPGYPRGRFLLITESLDSVLSTQSLMAEGFGWFFFERLMIPRFIFLAR